MIRTKLHTFIPMRSHKRSGFTLPELLVSMTVLLLLMTLLAAMLSQVQQTWVRSEGRISQFREARIAFDVMSKNLAQSSLNTYWDYKYDSNGQPEEYKRQSELHFVSFNSPQFSSSDGTVVGHSVFFQAPLGYSNEFRNLNNLFNARGYYVMFGGDDKFRPSFVDAAEKYRFRLMEYFPPAEENQVFNDADEERLKGDDAAYDSWYRHKLEEFSHPLAENIITLVVSPRESLDKRRSGGSTPSTIASSYEYDSSDVTTDTVHQVPPLVKLSLVAIDETSAIQLAAEYGTGVPTVLGGGLFSTSGNYQRDIDSVKDALDAKRISYKIFSTAVGIRSSKWSKNN